MVVDVVGASDEAATSRIRASASRAKAYEEVVATSRASDE